MPSGPSVPEERPISRAALSDDGSGRTDPIPDHIRNARRGPPLDARMRNLRL